MGFSPFFLTFNSSGVSVESDTSLMASLSNAVGNIITGKATQPSATKDTRYVLFCVESVLKLLYLIPL